MELEAELQKAVEYYWHSRRGQTEKQQAKARLDAGNRSAVTGGGQMHGMEQLVVQILREAGLDELTIYTGSSLELPGYFRAEKKWDLLVVSKGLLVAALEFKSQVGPSFGNNFNNRSEEAIGNAVDLWTAFRENRLGSYRPLLGYFFLLHDCEKVHNPVKNKEPFFSVDPAFKGASYSKRYELLLRRLVLERHYDCACLVLSTDSSPVAISQPSEDLSFRKMAAELRAAAVRFLEG